MRNYLGIFPRGAIGNSVIFTERGLTSFVNGAKSQLSILKSVNWTDSWILPASIIKRDISAVS
jgi:hypothetical protein